MSINSISYRGLVGSEGASMKAKENDEDVLSVVTKALRRSSGEDRTCVMELIVGEMIDHGDWASLMWWQGEIANAISEYLRMLARTDRAVCGCCWDNLSDDLKQRLAGKIEVARAIR